MLLEVKIRSLNQGLGSIPASKKWASGNDPSFCPKNTVMGPFSQNTSVIIPEQHFLSAGIESQKQKLFGR